MNARGSSRLCRAERNGPRTCEAIRGAVSAWMCCSFSHAVRAGRVGSDLLPVLEWRSEGLCRVVPACAGRSEPVGPASRQQAPVTPSSTRAPVGAGSPPTGGHQYRTTVMVRFGGGLTATVQDESAQQSTMHPWTGVVRDVLQSRQERLIAMAAWASHLGLGRRAIALRRSVQSPVSQGPCVPKLAACRQRSSALSRSPAFSRSTAK